MMICMLVLIMTQLTVQVQSNQIPVFVPKMLYFCLEADSWRGVGAGKINLTSTPAYLVNLWFVSFSSISALYFTKARGTKASYTKGCFTISSRLQAAIKHRQSQNGKSD